MKRKLILTVAACGVVIALAAGIHAQTPSATPDGGKGHGGGLLGHLSWALGLSSTQQAAAQTIVDGAKPQIQAIRQQAKQQIDGVLGNVQSQLNPILTGSQQSRLAAILQHVEAGPGLGGGGRGFGGFGGHRGFDRGPGGGPGAFGKGDGLLNHLTNALGLTDAQVAQIKPLLETAHTQTQAIFSNQNLTQQEKVQQVTSIMQTTNGQINATLSQAQQAAFAQMKDGRGGRGRRFHGPGGGEASPAPSVSGS